MPPCHPLLRHPAALAGLPRVFWHLLAALRAAAFWSVLASALLLPQGARADRPQWILQTFPFDQALDMEAVYQVSHSPPHRLIETIRRWGVDLLLVRSQAPARPLNPLLADLPPATPELLRSAGFQDSYEGLVVHAGRTDCARDQTTIFIRDTASSYTLIHEFVQSRLRPLCPGVSDEVLEARFGAAFRRLKVYQRRLYDDPFRLLNPQWRRDILSAQSDVAADLYDRIRLGQSQEAIVEKVLGLYIDERNPYFDAARREQGRVYGELMINNAIDLFNAVHQSVVFVEETVVQLGRSLRNGDITAGEGIALTDEDQLSVVRSATDVKARLERVRTELDRLRRFYLQ